MVTKYTHSKLLSAPPACAEEDSDANEGNYDAGGDSVAASTSGDGGKDQAAPARTQCQQGRACPFRPPGSAGVAGVQPKVRLRPLVRVD